MPDKLIIHLDPAGHSWTRLGGAIPTAQSISRGSLQEAAQVAEDCQVIVIVPGVDVLTTQVNLPVSGHKLLTALPYALEDQLAEDIDELHFAVGKRDPEGHTEVAVLRQSVMNDWLSILAKAGIDVDKVVADTHSLDSPPGTITLIFADDQVLLNNGAGTRMSLPGCTPEDVMATLEAAATEDASETESAIRLRVYADADNEARYQHHWNALRNTCDSFDLQVLEDGALPFLASFALTDEPINLLQGQYAAKHKGDSLFKPWKPAALLAASLLLLVFIVKATSVYQLRQQEAELQDEFNALYQTAVPGAPQTLDPVAVSNSLKRRFSSNPQSAPVFLAALHQVASAIPENGSIVIEAVSYRSGITDLRVTAPNVSALDSLQQAIADNGRFQASIQSTDQNGDRISSRIQVQERS